MKKILIFISAIILSIASFELFLSFSPFKYGLSPVKYDSKLGMWHKKNFSDYKISTCYKTKYIFDNNGLPKNIHPYNKNKKDIIILGDSYIEALMVKNENIIHNSLSKAYNHRYNFLNYGLSGSSPTQQLIILKEKIDLSNTQYITQFIFIEGDLLDVDSAHLGLFQRPKVFVKFTSFKDYKIIPPRKSTLYDKIIDLMGNFELYTFIKKVLHYIKDYNFLKSSNTITSPKQTKKIEQLNLNKNWLYLKGAIFQINKLALKKNIIYKPIIISKNTQNIHVMEKFLKTNNISYIILNNEKTIKLKGFDCDSHWNDETHKNIASHLKNINFFK